MMEQIRQETAAAVRELCEKAGLRPGQILVVGCSTSEVRGSRIGTDSAPETGRVLLEAIAAELERSAASISTAASLWNGRRSRSWSR